MCVYIYICRTCFIVDESVAAALTGGNRRKITAVVAPIAYIYRYAEQSDAAPNGNHLLCVFRLDVRVKLVYRRERI